MTVKELKAALLDYPDDWKVIASVDERAGGNPAFAQGTLGSAEMLFHCINGNDAVLLSNWNRDE
jgi:hypothetical protein